MAKRKPKKKPFKLWHWALVALAAFGLYKGLEHYLSPRPAKPKKVVNLKTPKAPTASPLPKESPAPSPPAASLTKFDFQSAAKLLPAGAYPDNYQTVPTKPPSTGLLAYAKLIPGKKPGPQGLTHTQPGLGYYRWVDQRYQDQELKFSDLSSSLPGINLNQVTGLPQLKTKPLIDGATQVFAVKLFLENDPRQLNAWVSIDAQGARWAMLADNKVLRPAAFWQGTTKSQTQQVRSETHEGHEYLIVETGGLNEAAPYEGYRWKVSAFRWDGNSFSLDKGYSEKLTRAK